MTTIAELVLRQAERASPAILFEDERASWAEFVDACAVRAAYLLDNRRPGPFHVGVLLDNVPEFPMWLGAVSLAGAAAVGINPTRRGSELARDIRHTDCQLIVTESRHLPLLEGLDTGVDPDRTLVVDDPGYAGMLAPYLGAPPPDVTIDPSGIYLLLFTSGTSGAPKAVICSQGRLARIGEIMVSSFGLTETDVFYLAMPMFHSNALMAGWAPCLAAGATAALRRRFSASGFLADVRRYRVTYFNYVGKPLSYILATPERPEDADNTLRLVFGNEAADVDIERFATRFGCVVIDGYGSTEGGASITRSPDIPRGALGLAPPEIRVMNPETMQECPPARFDEEGHLLNPDEAIGEIVNTSGAGMFEGYYKNEEANAARLRNGWYWTGDLGYKDERGFLYFAGRDFEWLRVDGENFAAAPIERILHRHPDVLLAAVYAVPDPDVGDRVMAALQLRPGASFDPDGFAAFLAAQPDLGTKWAPRFVRVSQVLPVTETNKVKKRDLRRERWECADPVWWRPQRDAPYVRLTPADVVALRECFAARGRLAALEAV
ncbi:MAG: acyl-CoA synthetase [Acidimicrobiia bacterium]